MEQQSHEAASGAETPTVEAQALGSARIEGTMKPMLRMALLVAAVMVAACGSQPAPRGSATTLPTYPNAGLITEFPLPTAGIVPAGITAGPDGNLWFIASTAVGNISKLGRITPAGQITEFPLAVGVPVEIVAGSDGNLWFTEESGELRRSTPAGQITTFRLPLSSGYPDSIAAGSDGNLWFTENPGNQIGRMTPAGHLTEFPLPNPKSVPNEITAGPDGNLWFTEYMYNDGQFAGSQIGRITPAGQISEFSLPTPGSSPAGITAGPDGNLWFTDCISHTDTNCRASQIGRITPTGQITEFALPTPQSISGAITTGADGNLWFTECTIHASGGACTGSRIGRITPTGQITEFALPRPASTPYHITGGPDGNLWFAEEHPGMIGRITSGT